MSSQQSNLWWAYDSETGSFSALPASPLLVPALIIMGIIALARGNPRPPATIQDVAGHLVDSPEWQANHDRYEHLLSRYTCNPDSLDNYEWLEMKRLGRYLMNPHGFAL
jgi:hypothetical protein